jgi:hypothetical protein
VGASSWQTWSVTLSPVEATPTAHGRQPSWSRAPLPFQDRWGFVGHCEGGVRSVQLDQNGHPTTQTCAARRPKVTASLSTA